MDTIEVSTAESWSGRATRRRAHSADPGTHHQPAAIVRDDALASRPAAIALKVIATILIVLPLFFGGMHPSVFGPAETAIFILGIYVAWRIQPTTFRSLCSGGTLRPFLAAVGVFGAAAAARTVVLWFNAAPDPVFGAPSGRALAAASLGGLREILFFVFVTVIARAAMLGRPAARDTLVRTIAAAGILCTAIGLAHWFYDNGKLFWFFEPHNVFISQRARWPFVNSNHLASFLLPTLFILIARYSTAAAVLRELAISQRTGRLKSWNDLMASPRVQRKVVICALSATAAFAVGMCIIATLSRGVWAGVFVGLIAFFGLDYATRPAPAVQAPESPSLHRESPRRRRRRGGSINLATIAPSASARRWMRLVAIALICIFLYGFLRDRGAELVESRIEYGLLHSKDDMRFQLLQDSLPLLQSNPWFGIGLGVWPAAYQTVMSPLLSGVNPGYLHNEPVQLLIELGLAGFIPVVCALLILVYRGVKSAPQGTSRVMLAAFIASILALGFATVFDFHLRVPAVVAQLAVLCALIIDLTELSADTTTLSA